MNDYLRDIAVTIDQIVASTGANLEGQPPADVRTAAFDGDLWVALHEAGMTAIGIAEKQGGSGGTLEEAATVVGRLASHAVHVPVAEHMLVALWAASRHDLSVPPSDSPIAFAHASEANIVESAGKVRLTGCVAGLRWAGTADSLLLLVPCGVNYRLCFVPTEQLAERTRSWDLSRDDCWDVRMQDLVLPDSVVISANDAQHILGRYALARAIQISSALDRICTWTLEYAGERSQFGRLLGQFQAVQEQLARMVAESVSSNATVHLAIRQVDDTDSSLLAARLAFLRARDAAGTVTRAAHQIHGAIGFTREHRLHLLTTRLWSWRADLGAESTLAEAVGRDLAGRGDLWSTLNELLY